MKPNLVFSGARRSSFIVTFLRDAVQRGQIGSCVGRAQRYHSAIIIRVMVTAVTIEVRMPSASETAKPRTGPEPRK